MMGLSDGERISMIRSAVLIQYTRVTDRRTELAWHIRAIVYAVARNNVFKNRLDKFWHDQEIIYDFNAQLQGTGSRSAVE